MKYTHLFMLSILAVFALVLVSASVSAVQLAQWTLTADGAASGIASGVSAGTFGFGSGISGEINNSATGTSWTDAAQSPVSDEYFQISIAPTSGNQLTLSNINFDVRRSGTGPSNYQVQYSKSSSFTNPTTLVTRSLAADSDTNGDITQSITVNNGETLYVRWFAYNASSVQGNFKVLANTLDIQGTVSAAPSSGIQFCRNGNQGGNLTVKDINIENNGDGDDDNWQFLDEVEVEVEVENEGNGDIDDVIVEIGLFDSSGSNQIDDVDFESADEEESDIGDLNDGDDETVTFTFRIPADMEDGSYRLVAKVYSDDLGENVECESSNIENIDVENEDDKGKFIAFDNIEMTPTEAVCGESITLVTDVFNVGEDDEDQVKVMLINTELGINEFAEIRNDLDVGDDEQVTMTFDIPQNAQAKVYQLRLTAEYDYRNGNYRESSDEATLVPLRVLTCDGSSSGSSGGNGDVNEDIAEIEAELVSDAVPGQELQVEVTVTNLKDSRSEFIIDVSGYERWADLEDISDRVLDIPAGRSETVTLTFIVDEDVEGEESFVFSTLSEGATQDQEISVNVEESSNGGFTGFNFGNNSFLWIIGFINVILIIIIIIVAVKISRR